MRCARKGRKLWCRTRVVVEAILVVDPVLTVAGVKVALTGHTAGDCAVQWSINNDSAVSRGINGRRS